MPVRCQAIIWTNVEILSFGPVRKFWKTAYWTLRNKLQRNWNDNFYSKKNYLKTSSLKCFRLNSWALSVKLISGYIHYFVLGGKLNKRLGPLNPCVWRCILLELPSHLPRSNELSNKISYNLSYNLYIYTHMYIYNCWKKSKLKSYVRPWFHG